jgi:chemotaxis protein MotB
VQYKISEKLHVFTQYQYGTSGSFTDSTGDLTINTHNFGLGLMIDISKSISSGVSTDTIQMNELRLEMEKNSQKIKELENDSAQADMLKQKIVAKEVELLKLKESISEALRPYNGNELTVKEEDGKVYIILENDMLFKSGSWKINSKGEETIMVLGSVLGENPDLKIQVEGHTDNKAFKENKMSNWDLSTKRASAIVQIFSQNENINPKNLTAAGKGEFDPIADNKTEEGRAINRRIEIIISPKLDEISNIINN